MLSLTRSSEARLVVLSRRRWVGHSLPLGREPLLLLLLVKLHLLVVLQLKFLLVHDLLLNLLLHHDLLMLQFFSNLLVVRSALLLLGVLLNHYNLHFLLLGLRLCLLAAFGLVGVQQLREATLLVELLHLLVYIGFEGALIEAVVEVLGYDLLLLAF